MQEGNQVELYLRVGGYVHCRFPGGKPVPITLSDDQEKDEEEKECASTLASFLAQSGRIVKSWDRAEQLYQELEGQPRPDFIFALENGSRMAVEIVRLYRDADDQRFWGSAQNWLIEDICRKLTAGKSRVACYIQVPSSGLPLRGSQKTTLANGLVQLVTDAMVQGASGTVSQTCTLPGEVSVRVSGRPASSPAVDFQLKQYSLVDENTVRNFCSKIIRDKAEKSQWNAVEADEKALFIAEEWGFHDYSMLQSIVKELRPDPLANDVQVFVGKRQFPETVQKLG